MPKIKDFISNLTRSTQLTANLLFLVYDDGATKALPGSAISAALSDISATTITVSGTSTFNGLVKFRAASADVIQTQVDKASTSSIQHVLGKLDGATSPVVFGNHYGANSLANGAFIAYNAYQPSNSNAWAQPKVASQSSLLQLDRFGLNIYSAIAGKSNGTFANFWGTPAVSVNNGGMAIQNTVGPCSFSATATDSGVDSFARLSLTNHLNHFAAIDLNSANAMGNLAGVSVADRTSIYATTDIILAVGDDSKKIVIGNSTKDFLTFAGTTGRPKLNTTIVPVYADNAAAIAGGLVAGELYRTPTGQLMIRY